MKYLINKIVVLFVIVGFGYLNSPAQEMTTGAAPDLPAAVEKGKESNDPVMQAQIDRLEAQVQLMQAQLAALKKSLAKSEKTTTRSNPVAETNQTAPKEANTRSSETAVVANKNTEKKDLSFDVGDFKVTPYGIIFFNAFGNTGGTNNADDPMWATPSGGSNASASGRQTRLGVRVAGGKLGNAAVSGVVEADFYGGFPGVGVGENMGVMRLRVAKVKFDWERTSLTLGQDWVIFAPNSPKSVAAAAIPQFAAAGNPWSRLPQARVEQKLGKNFKWQGAILAPGTGDFPTGGSTPVLLQPGSGASSKIPFFQSRISYSNANWFGSTKPGTIGFAGHFGRSRVTIGNTSTDVDSTGLAVDWSFPIVKRVTLAGEAFVGTNLGGFQAGIFQGYNTDFGVPQTGERVGEDVGTVRGIRTRGGWVQLGFNLPAFEDRLTAYVSTGIDDPRNRDLMTISPRNFRSRNFGYAFDLIYKFSPNFSIGSEVRRLETTYLLSGTRNATHLNLGGAYTF
jgi:hypothetical protein